MEAQEEVLRRFNIPDPTSDKYVSDARYQAIRRDTPTDQTLKRVAEVITAGWPRSIDQLPQLVRPYWTWRDELTILDGILYKGTRIIIPKSLQRDIIDRLHSSHQGTAATPHYAGQEMQCTGRRWQRTSSVSQKSAKPA